TIFIHLLQVYLWRGQGRILVNREPLDAFFSDLLMRSSVLRPLAVTGLTGQIDAVMQVRPKEDEEMFSWWSAASTCMTATLCMWVFSCQFYSGRCQHVVLRSVTPFVQW